MNRWTFWWWKCGFNHFCLQCPYAQVPVQCLFGEIEQRTTTHDYLLLRFLYLSACNEFIMRTLSVDNLICNDFPMFIWQTWKLTSCCALENLTFPLMQRHFWLQFPGKADKHFWNSFIWFSDQQAIISHKKHDLNIGFESLRVFGDGKRTFCFHSQSLGHGVSVMTL